MKLLNRLQYVLVGSKLVSDHSLKNRRIVEN